MGNTYNILILNGLQMTYEIQNCSYEENHSHFEKKCMIKSELAESESFGINPCRTYRFVI
jgi:hypothetical protein